MLQSDPNGHQTLTAPRADAASSFSATQWPLPGMMTDCTSSATSGQGRHLRSDLNAARTSVEKSRGSSQAAKWPPLSTLLK